MFNSWAACQAFDSYWKRCCGKWPLFVALWSCQGQKWKSEKKGCCFIGWVAFLCGHLAWRWASRRSLGNSWRSCGDFNQMLEWSRRWSCKVLRLQDSWKHHSSINQCWMQLCNLESCNLAAKYLPHSDERSFQDFLSCFNQPHLQIEHNPIRYNFCIPRHKEFLNCNSGRTTENSASLHYDA